METEESDGLLEALKAMAEDTGDVPVFEKRVLLSGRPNRETPIGDDDLVNLKIMLALDEV